jgi:hypothetical protein
VLGGWTARDPPMTLMSLGLCNELAGAFLSSVLY